MQKQANESILRAILHSLPNAVIALDDSDNILVANTGAARLLKTKREHLEGGSIFRFLLPNENISSTAHSVNFNTAEGNIALQCISKEVQVDDESIKVILLRRETNESQSLLNSVKSFSLDDSDPYQKLCETLIIENIASKCEVVFSSNQQNEVIASANNGIDIDKIDSSTSTITHKISEDDNQKLSLILVPSSTHGLTKNDLELIDLFISLIHLKVRSEETSSDADGSEAALALALKSGSMGLCFFDTSTKDCYLSDRLASWCGINPEKFDGTLQSWVSTFAPQDASRVNELISKLPEQKKFKTLVNLSTLEEGEKRIEISGRPINENNRHQWVAIVKEFNDKSEVEAAWKTRIAMEEAARVEAENSLEDFENILHDTLLPTTSDVSIVSSRQDAGTFHIVRPINETSSIYGVGAITTNDRTHAVVGAAIVATIADVLATKTTNIEEYVNLIRDHARARDIETTMAAVLVSNSTINAASVGGASVYISGKAFNGTQEISATTAISISSHSEASPDSVEVAANGRPWKIMTSVIEVLGHIDTDAQIKSSAKNNEYNDDDFYGEYKGPSIAAKAESKDEKDEIVSLEENAGDNVSTFRGGSISPS